jgi:hypothetical protein
MEIIDNRGKDSRIVGAAYLEPEMEVGRITKNPTHQTDHIPDMTAGDPSEPILDSLEDNRGRNNPSLENLRQRKYR